MFRPPPDIPDLVCSMGYEAVQFIETNCCHGPGDLQGQPAKVDDEMYEFLVETYKIDRETGRKVYDESVLSRPKGRAKTELAGWLVCFEAFGNARFDHWETGPDGSVLPAGRKVTSPLIKCLATEESQATAAFSVVAYIIEWGQDTHPEIYKGVSGSRRYQSATALYLPWGGEIRACTSGAASKDGGKETFCVADEVHLYVLRELKEMYGTVRRNLGKRKLAEPWMLLTTTAYRPGEQSVAEDTLTAWRKGELSPSVHVDHREAKGRIDIGNREHTMAQLRQVYGVAATWMDLDRVYREMCDPRSCPDDATAARYFLNRAISSRDAWIPDSVVERQARRGDTITAGEHITVGFDGSLNDDSTVLMGARMSDGFLFKIGIWAKPSGPEGTWWEVPRQDVLATIHETFARYDVVRAYFDPHEWRSDIDDLQAVYGERVSGWATSRDVAMGGALDRLHADLSTGTAWHDGDPVVMEHLRNTYVRRKGAMRLVRKEHPNSDRKIDSTVGLALAYEARADALSDGYNDAPPDHKVIIFRQR